MFLFCTSTLFAIPAAGLLSCSRFRGTQGNRPNTKAQVRALAEVRGTCSRGSKSQVTTGRYSERVEPSRPSHIDVQVKKCPTAHVISRILNLVNVVRQHLVTETYFPDTNVRDIRPLIVQEDTISTTSEG